MSHRKVTGERESAQYAPEREREREGERERERTEREGGRREREREGEREHLSSASSQPSQPTSDSFKGRDGMIYISPGPCMQPRRRSLNHRV